MVISTMNITGAEVAVLSMGAKVKYNFPGNCCHLFSKETSIFFIKPHFHWFIFPALELGNRD